MLYRRVWEIAVDFGHHRVPAELSIRRVIDPLYYVNGRWKEESRGIGTDQAGYCRDVVFHIFREWPDEVFLYFGFAEKETAEAQVLRRSDIASIQLDTMARPYRRSIR